MEIHATGPQIGRRHLAGAAALLLSGWQYLPSDALGGPPSPAALLPDAGGQIQSVVLSVNSARRAALRNAGLVTQIVNSLPPEATVYIVTNDLAAFSVGGNTNPERIQFIELPPENPITIWTQDPFLVLEAADGEPTLLESRAFGRAEDRLMAKAIAERAGLGLVRSGLSFEGGNLVADSKTVFVGANTIRNNAVELGLAEEEVALRFEEELGRQVLVVGPFPQPVSHIDMMLTPIGSRTLLLGDPGAGAAIARRSLRDDPESVRAFETACEENFFGHPSIRSIQGEGGKLIEAPPMGGETARMADLSEQLAPVFDGIAEGLAGHGYQVLRIPFLFGGPESVRPDVGQSGQQAGYPMLTYNNVILESDDEHRRVYVPRYGFPAMDNAAARAWSEAGFDTTAVDGLTISAMYGGALRCSVKVLRRGPPGGYSPSH